MNRKEKRSKAGYILIFFLLTLQMHKSSVWKGVGIGLINWLKASARDVRQAVKSIKEIEIFRKQIMHYLSCVNNVTSCHLVLASILSAWQLHEGG